jgi:hypothetical protein
MVCSRVLNPPVPSWSFWQVILHAVRWRSVSMRRQLVACGETPTAEFKRPHCASTMAWLGSYHDRGWFLWKKLLKMVMTWGLFIILFQTTLIIRISIFFSEKEMLLISVDYNYRFYFQIVWSSWTIRKLWVYFEYYHYHFCCSNI